MEKGRPKKCGSPNLLNIEWTRNAQIAGKWKKIGKYPNQAKCKYRKMKSKNNRERQIHPTLSGQEMPKYSKNVKKRILENVQISLSAITEK